MVIRCALIAWLCGWGSVASAQSQRLNNTSQLWSEVDAMGHLAARWKWQVDLQYSRQSNYEELDLLRSSEQLTVRSWLHFYPIPTIKLSTFVGLWSNFAIPEAGARKYQEFRAAVQGQHYAPRGRNLVINRLRPELRELEDRAGRYESVFRLRYMLKYQRLLLHDRYDRHALYTILFDELFLNGGSDVTGHHVFDQNRVFVGLGYDATADLAIELGYCNQLQQHAHDDNLDVNHILQVSVIFDVPN